MSDKEFTYEECKSHSGKKDLYLVIHDKVYDTTSFVDEHPGGEEVLLDVGGVDATEAFEDVGHSDEAREILEGLLIGALKRMPGDPEPKGQRTVPTSMNRNADSYDVSSGTNTFLILIIGILMASGVYYVLNMK